MSLNAEEVARNNRELNENFRLTGLTGEQIRTDLGWSAERLAVALGAPGATDPVDVWELRDYLEHAVKDAGREPVPFTVLTAGSRLKAHMWFRLRKAPRHDFAAA